MVTRNPGALPAVVLVPPATIPGALGMRPPLMRERLGKSLYGYDAYVYWGH